MGLKMEMDTPSEMQIQEGLLILMKGRRLCDSPLIK
jgi:hypothetical protein